MIPTMIPHLPIPARFRIYLRFVRYLLWEFRWPLGIFAGLVRRRRGDPALASTITSRSPSPGPATRSS